MPGQFHLKLCKACADAIVDAIADAGLWWVQTAVRLRARGRLGRCEICDRFEEVHIVVVRFR